jgi:arylsulfatase A-like enzyme
MSQQPNILWIMSDQHNANCMGCAGHPDVRTPHLDRLAAEGVRFERAYCNNPICAPSRCSAISGQYPWTTGITGNRTHELDVPNPGTLPTVLRQMGYQTALVGKSHMIGRWDREGFEHIRYCDLCDADGGDPTTVAYFQHLIDNGLADDYDLGTRFEGQAGHRLHRFVSRIPLAHSLEVWTGDEALQFLGQRDRSRPFMMQVSFQRPHEPLCVPPEIADWYDPAKLHLPESAADYFERRFAGKPRFQQEYVSGGEMGYPYRPQGAEDLKGQMAYYFTLITLIDEQIGRIVAELKRTGDYENTIICYVADHGDFAGEHGLILKNLGIYESIHRTPFLLRYPGGPAGRVVGHLVELVDLFPTLMAAADLPSPRHCDGRSLLPLIAGRERGLDHTVCLYDFHAAQPCSIAVRSASHRLVLYPWQPQEIGELYDVQADPGELHNHWDDADYREVRLELTQQALAQLSRFSRRWSTRNDTDPRLWERPTTAMRVQEQGVAWSKLMAERRATTPA